MLAQPTLEKLRSLKLNGMLEALERQTESREIKELEFEERLGLLLDAEDCHKRAQKFSTRLKSAKLRQSACIEDIDFKYPRGLDRGQFLSLGNCRWIIEHNNVLISGSTGVGKTYLACALGQMCCRAGYRVLYQRMPRLIQELAVARADGRYTKILASWSKLDLLIIDDFGLSPLTPEATRDFLEVLDDRYNTHSTLVASQLPIKHWHETMQDATLADAVLDRLVHNAYKLELKGDSMRKNRGKGE